jgi:phage shock protein E
MTRYVALSLCFAFTLLFSIQLRAADLEHTKDTLDSVKTRIAEKKAILVDVRDMEEWKEGHIKDAVHLPLRDLMMKVDAEKIKEKLPKDKIIYTHCAAGVRSLKAGKILVDLGYDIRPLKPGFEALVKAGFESTKD